MGDSDDNIPGLPKWGPIKARKYLQEHNYSADSVLELYKKTYEDEWVDYFLSNGKLLFIQRYPDDHFTLKRFQELEAASGA